MRDSAELGATAAWLVAAAVAGAAEGEIHHRLICELDLVVVEVVVAVAVEEVVGEEGADLR